MNKTVSAADQIMLEVGSALSYDFLTLYGLNNLSMISVKTIDNHRLITGYRLRGIKC